MELSQDDMRIEYLRQFYTEEQISIYCEGSEGRLNELYADSQPVEVSIAELYDVNDSVKYLCDSPDGWVPVEQWRYKGIKQTYELTCCNGTVVTASYDHLFQKDDGTWVVTEQLRPGDRLLTVDGGSAISQVVDAGMQPVYDLAIGHENHRYYTNKVSSHNSGKSLILQNLALNWVMAGHVIVYFTLELSEDLVAHRLDAMITGFTTREVCGKIDDTAILIRKFGKRAGTFAIKKLPEGGTNTNTLRACLKEFQIKTGLKPDGFIVDYLDLMYPNDRIDMSNLFVKDKYVSEELRGLWDETNTFGATASQLNRCLSLDTKVRDEQRGVIELKDVTEGDHIMGSTGFVSVKNIFPITRQKAYRVRTKSGKTVICSGNHTFPTTRGILSINDGLRIGDVLFMEM